MQSRLPTTQRLQRGFCSSHFNLRALHFSHPVLDLVAFGFIILDLLCLESNDCFKDMGREFDIEVLFIGVDMEGKP